MWKTTVASGYRFLVWKRHRSVYLYGCAAVTAQQALRCSSVATTNGPAIVDRENNNSNSLPANRLIDFQVAAKIDGEESHVATVELQPGETLRAESGAMIFMTEGIVSKLLHELFCESS
jgi:hypothetical protein